MKNGKFGISLKKLIACLLLVIMIPVSALASFEAKSTASVKVFSKTSTASTYYLGTLSKGKTVTVKDETGEWYKITYNGKTGYAKSKYFTAVSKSTAYTAKSVSLYQKASSGSKVLDTLSANYPLTVLGKSGSYSYVQTKDGSQKGYVRTSYLSSSSKDPFAVSSSHKKSYDNNGSTTTMPSSVKSKQSYMSKGMSNSKKIDYMIYAAQSKLGCKYSSSPNDSYTFNNGSFVRACYKVLGYSLSRSVKDIGHKGKYAYIARNKLKRGDIVCFECDTADSNIVDHVGIYLGSGYFIHASNTADRVIVSKMSSGYYYKAFCWGRRVIG